MQILPRSCVALIWLILAASLCVGILGRGYWTPDEPREADLAWRMSWQPSKAVPLLAGEAFCEKPPLTYWLAGATIGAGGSDAWVARLPNLLYALITALAVAMIARRGAGPIAGIAAAAAISIGEVGREKASVDQDEAGGHRAGEPQRPLPDLAHGDEQEHARHQHGRRHGDAVGGGEVVGLAEADGEHQRHDHQHPVDRADVDLPVALLRGLGDGHARHPAELDRLAGHRRGAGDDRLAGDHRRHGGEQDHGRQQRPGQSRKKMLPSVGAPASTIAACPA